MAQRLVVGGLAAAVLLLASCFGGDKKESPAPGDGSPSPGAPQAAKLVVGGQSSLGYDTIIYWSVGCYACGRPEVPNLYRRHLRADGMAVSIDLFAPLRTAGGHPASFAADWARGDLWVLWCRKGNCGGEGEVSADAVMVLMRSEDGGVTWTDAALALDRVYTALIGTSGGEVIVARYPAGAPVRYTVYPGGQDVPPPAGDGPLSGEYAPGIGTVWLKQGSQGPEGPYLNQGGEPILQVPGKPQWRGFVEANPVWRLAQWQGEGDAPPSMFGFFDVQGVLQRTWQWDQRYAPQGGPGHGYMDIAGALDDKRAYGTVLLQDFFAFGTGQPTADAVRHGRLFPVEIAIFDLQTNTVHPMIGFSDDPPAPGIATPTQNANPFVVHMETGPVKRVKAPSDCANVRESPSTSATVLTCYRDNVLLGVRDEPPRDAEGRNWTPVTTPDGREGWVATEFID